jgi:hypothetical protein
MRTSERAPGYYLEELRDESKNKLVKLLYGERIDINRVGRKEKITFQKLRTSGKL